MSDKQKIKEEIERLKDKGKYSDIYDYAFRDGNNNALDAIARFIDSLPEESKCIYNRTLDERKKFCKYCSAACDIRIEEESANEDLEEAAYNYCEKINHRQTDIITDSFKAGAEWQKQKDQETIELAEDHAMLAGMEKMKEEMMKDAVDATIFSELKDSNRSLFQAKSDRFRMNGVKIGDIIKVIPIKTEQQ